jgi:hypothetical protein
VILLTGVYYETASERRAEFLEYVRCNLANLSDANLNEWGYISGADSAYVNLTRGILTNVSVANLTVADLVRATVSVINLLKHRVSHPRRGLPRDLRKKKEKGAWLMIAIKH